MQKMLANLRYIKHLVNLLRIISFIDPNIALFVTMAFIIIEAEFGCLIPDDLSTKMRKAMIIAVEGDERRVGGVDNDNLYPCYTNVRM
jgi:hypothetical protein